MAHALNLVSAKLIKAANFSAEMQNYRLCLNKKTPGITSTMSSSG